MALFFDFRRTNKVKNFYKSFLQYFSMILLLSISVLYAQEKKEILLLQKAIDSFLAQKYDKTRNYLIQVLQTNTEARNNKEYLKLQFYINFINNNYFNANQYFLILEESDFLDDFLVYFRILFLLNLKQYEETVQYLEKIKFSSVYSKEEFSLLPFLCNPEDKNNLDINLRKPDPQALWRESITQKEKEFINFLKQILIYRNTTQISIIEDCIQTSKNIKTMYHLYRLLLWIQPSKQNYFMFYHFLYENQNFLEALHVLRTIYSFEPFSYKDPDFLLIIFNFKKLYEKLNYQKNVDTLTILIKALMNKYDLTELKKIATQNYQCRELLVFLLYTTEESKKSLFTQKINEYDINYDMNEKISFFKKIYKYD